MKTREQYEEKIMADVLNVAMTNTGTLSVSLSKAQVWNLQKNYIFDGYPLPVFFQ